MQFHRFDLNLLIALDTLLRERNITRAAEKVFVSQPAMSAALHRLRDYFDDPLLVRVGRNYELTPRGIRKIGQRSLEEIFSTLKRDAFGKHRADSRGRGGDPTDEPPGNTNDLMTTGTAPEFSSSAPMSM